MITNEGVMVPEELLIGIEQGKWPIRVFYNNATAAADWLATGSEADRKHIFRVRLEPVEELVRVPPVPASLMAMPVVPMLVKEDVGDA